MKSSFLSVNIQVKATEQYFPVVLFIMLRKVVLSFQSVVEMKSYGVTVQLRATEHIFVWYLLLWFTWWSLLFGQYCCYLFHFISYMYYFSLIIFFYSRIITMGSRHPWRPLTPTALGPRMVILEMKMRRMMVLRDVYGRPEELNNDLLIPFSDWYCCWSHKK